MTERDIRTQIIEAAAGRFSQYGYGKTTMVEIASDCDMSAANLYRYYKNKLDIGSAMAQLFFNEEYYHLKKIVDRKDLPFSQKLENFTLHSLHHCHNYFTNSPRVIELVEVMSVKNRCVCDNHQQKKVGLLEEMLEQANDSGDFIIEDIKAVAESIQMATLIFNMPTMMPHYSLEELELRAKTLCMLLASGLQKAIQA